MQETFTEWDIKPESGLIASLVTKDGKVKLRCLANNNNSVTIVAGYTNKLGLDIFWTVYDNLTFAALYFCLFITIPHYMKHFDSIENIPSNIDFKDNACLASKFAQGTTSIKNREKLSVCPKFCESIKAELAKVFV